MIQDRLFRLAPEAMHLQATFVAGRGWHLSFVCRRQDEQWPEALRDTYDSLSTPELMDVVIEVLANQLGLA